jgi:tripartite-type tricarboxylate transporter receptor subunit TctC
MHKRLALAFAFGFASIVAMSAAMAEEWPSRPIHAIVPLSAGSAVDVVPRIVFEQLSKQLKQPIIVENKPGASGTIGARVVVTAEPDGYTILAHSSALVIAPSTVPNLPYDPIKDLTPVAALANLPNVLVVSPSTNIKTIKDLVALGKQRPITFGSIGVGNPVQLSMQRLRMSAGFDVRTITFRGAPEAIVEAMTGRIDAYYSPVTNALPLIRDHKLIPLVVSSPTRSSVLPDVPTSEEAGYPNSAYRFWIGIFAPAKTPAAIVDKLSKEIEKALLVPEVQEKLAKLGVQPMSMNDKQFAEFVKHELVVNTELTKAAGIAVQ